ncbi:MAG: ribosome-associated translation inhibitor RaiA [Bacteroidales bacterium]|nr:ribosome-associated translation inhibitor RaiA [Bacteroidales bacterium]MDZ4204770.1 ribosome-associated translation inhibitor RaiA [Bacteroidales bacterium]
MKISITTVRFKSDSKLDDFVQEKVEKLSGFYDGIIASEVTLKLDNNDKQENKVAEIKLNIRGNDLFAKKQSKTFEEAVDLSVEAIRKQLTRYKEKIRL